MEKWFHSIAHAKGLWLFPALPFGLALGVKNISATVSIYNLTNKHLYSWVVESREKHFKLDGEYSSYFFRYAKKLSVLREDLVQLRSPCGTIVDGRTDICELLLSHFSSVFSDPSSSTELMLSLLITLISWHRLIEETIIDSIKDMVSNSSPGPDGLHASIFKNCAKSLVKPLKNLFESMFEETCIPSTLKKSCNCPYL